MVVIGPLGEEVPGRGRVDGALVEPARELPGVKVVSPEVFVLTTLDGRSAFVRGVSFREFLALEGGSLVEGEMPDEPHEALAGADMARAMGLAVGERLLVPAALARSAVPVRIVGVADFDGAPREQLLVPLDTARGLANLTGSQVHVLRVRADRPDEIESLVRSPGPVLRYSDVRLSPASPVLGEPVVVTATLANWGSEAGTKLVELRDGERVVASVEVEVPARGVVPVRLEATLPEIGAHALTLNPTIPVEVRPPELHFVDLPPSAPVGEPLAVRLVDSGGRPAAGIDVRVEDGPASRTDAEGRAAVPLPRPGPLRVYASAEGTTRAVAEIVGSLPTDPVGPRGVATRIALLDEAAGDDRPVRFAVDVRNAGDAEGDVEVALLVDGAPAATGTLRLARGAEGRVALAAPPLPAGRHVATVEGSPARLEFKSYPGPDPRAAMLRERYAAEAAPAPDSARDAEAYVDELLGNVQLAVLVLSVASGGLAAAGAVAVLARHLGDRAGAVDALRALGATRGQIRARAAREAVAWGGLASVLGALAGVVAALVLDASGIVRAFGHGVEPVVSGPVLAIVAVVATWVVAGVAAALADRPRLEMRAAERTRAF